MIYVMHGVVQARSQHLLTHQWMLDAEQFDRFLKERLLFVPLADALTDQGDALTIDDATQAAYHAALLARDHGHEVALFVNSESTADYLYVLSSLLDAAQSGQLVDLYEEYLPGKLQSLHYLREVLKHSLIRLPGDEARMGSLDRLASKMGFRDVSIPSHLRSLSHEQLENLIDRGVRLENHGATHVDYSIFQTDEVRTQITSCRSWLSSLYGQDARYFAVPFGNVLPRFDVGDEVASCWLIQNKDLYCGLVGPRIYNREEIAI